MCGFGLLGDTSSSTCVHSFFANAYCVLCTPVSVFLGRDARPAGFLRLLIVLCYGVWRTYLYLNIPTILGLKFKFTESLDHPRGRTTAWDELLRGRTDWSVTNRQMTYSSSFCSNRAIQMQTNKQDHYLLELKLYAQ